MTKSIKTIMIAVMAVLTIGLLTFICIDGGNPDAMQSCSFCEGAGTLTAMIQEDTAECSECLAPFEEHPEHVCYVCEGLGKVEAESNFFGSWVSLVAPVIAIVLALITKEVYSSLLIGIVVGGLFAFNYDPVKTVDGVVQNGLIDSVSGTAGIFVFLVVLGIMVALINQSGGSAAFGRWAQTHIKSRVGASLCTFVLGVLIFIDDYFNCLTVGGVMRPVTDSHKISRAKLAFIIDATAAPVCMIAPISSWAAAVSSYAKEGEGLSLFVKAIPYNLYSLLALAFVIAITVMKFDFGPMKRHEMRAFDGYLSSDDSKISGDSENGNAKGRVLDLVLPVLILVIVCVLAMIYVGGFFGGSNNGDFIGAFGDTDATVALPLGGLVALVVTIIYFMIRRITDFKQAMDCVPKGFIAMVPAILILTMATGLKNITGLLGADVFVENLMTSSAEGFQNFLPAIIFLVAIGLAFSTGTSWGTFGILIPIVIAIFPDTSELQIISMSACLAGAVCGDHCSPISDTTIMSSAGAQCDHVDHVSTQLPYAMLVAGISFVGYVFAGFVQNAWVTLAFSFVLMIGILFAIRAATSKMKS